MIYDYARKEKIMITLNETPVRTARNFNINNIKIEKINNLFKYID